MEEEKIVKGDVSKNKVISSLIWKFMEVGGTQIIRFVVQVVLARLLCPEDYGVMAIIFAFITVSDVFIQSGFSTALVQKKESDELDFSSVFYLILFISTVLYIILFFSAPAIARFYNMDILKSVLRVISIVLFFDAINAVQNAMVQKTMQFKKFFFSNMGGTVASGIAGVVLAFKDFGVWTLVIQQLVNSLLITLILWFTVKWRPSFKFSFSRLKVLFAFGWKLTVSALIDCFYKQLYSLTIGKFYTQGELGEFNKGEQFPNMIEYTLDGSIQGVMMPTLSAHNGQSEKIKAILRKTVSTSSYIIIPCMFGMAAVSRNLVIVLLSEKWLGCVPFLMLSCLFYCLYPIQTSNQTAINAMGRSDIYLKIEIIKKIVGVVILFVSIPFGLIPMAWGRVLSGVFASVVTVVPNRKILGYKFREVLQDVVPSLAAGSLMFCAVYAVQYINLKPLIMLPLQIVLGGAVYLLFSVLFRIKAFVFVKNELKEKIRK